MTHTKLTSTQTEQLNRLKEIHDEFDKLAHEHHEIGNSLKLALPDSHMHLGVIIMAIAPIEKDSILQEDKHDTDSHHSYCLAGDMHSLSVGLADFMLKNSDMVEAVKHATTILVSHEIIKIVQKENQSKNN